MLGLIKWSKILCIMYISCNILNEMFFLKKVVYKKFVWLYGWFVGNLGIYKICKYGLFVNF